MSFDLEQQMDVIRHDHILIHRDRRITDGNLLDGMICELSVRRKLHILRTSDARPYILPEQVFTVFGAKSDKIGTWGAVFVFRQAEIFAGWHVT